MADLGRAYVQIVPSAEGISGSITSALAPEAQSAGKATGKSMGAQLGSTVAKTVAALGIGKMIGDSISNGMNYQSSLAKTSTLFTGTNEEFEAFKGTLMDISDATGVAVSELAEAAYSAESASIPMENLGGIIESSAKLAKGGFTDIDTALSATAKTMNAYGMVSDDAAKTQANMEKVQRILIQTQNKGITTVGELGASLSQVTPTAAAFGVSFEQVGAALAGMTAQGVPTAQATTQLNSLIAELGKEGTQAANNLKAAAEGTEFAGMSFSDMMNNGLDLNDVLGMMSEYADANGLSMVDMFSSIEAGKGALAIDSSNWNENMEAMATEADVVSEAYSTMSETVSEKLQVFKNKLTNLGIGIFTLAMNGLNTALEGALEIFDNIKAPLENLGTAFQNMFKAFGPAFSKMLGLNDELSTTQLVSDGLDILINAVADAFNFLAENAEPVAAIILTAAEAFAAYKIGVGLAAVFSHPLIAILGALAVAGVFLYKNWDTIKEKAQKLWEAISEKFESIKTAITEAWDNVKTTTSETWNTIKTKVSGFTSGIQSNIATKWLSIKTNTSTRFTEAKTAISDALTAAKTTVETIAGNIKTAISNAWTTAATKTVGVFNGIKATISSAISATYEKVKFVFNAIKNAIEKPIEAAKKFVGDAIEAIKGFFDFEWSLPELKLPHIVVDGYIDIPVIGKIPDPTKIRVDWYKTGGIFDNPSLIGVGEAGPEAVVPLSGRQMLPFARAIASELGGRGATVNIYTTVNGAEDPEAYATRLARQLQMELRTV